MGFIESNKLFEEKYLSKTDNVFEAVNMWAKEASNVYNQFSGSLSNSESLDYALTSNLPENYFNRIPKSEVSTNYIKLYVREALQNVDDKKVKFYVLCSIKKSQLNKNLVFIYDKSLSPSRKARVRVLSKLIWYNLYPEEGTKDV